jgi:hypothetical protein
MRLHEHAEWCLAAVDPIRGRCNCAGSPILPPRPQVTLDGEEVEVVIISTSPDDNESEAELIMWAEDLMDSLNMITDKAATARMRIILGEWLQFKRGSSKPAAKPLKVIH